MFRVLLFVVIAGAIAIGGGVLMLGIFPPAAHPQKVEKVVPNDRFQGH
jgi:hypothetical protein